MEKTNFSEMIYDIKSSIQKHADWWNKIQTYISGLLYSVEIDWNKVKYIFGGEEKIYDMDKEELWSQTTLWVWMKWMKHFPKEPETTKNYNEIYHFIESLPKEIDLIVKKRKERSSATTEEVTKTLDAEKKDTPYTFTHQLNSFELEKLMSSNYNRTYKADTRKWSANEVNELLKNDIISSAYTQWNQLHIHYSDGVRVSWYPFVQIDYWVDLPSDYSEVLSYEPIKGKSMCFYPNDILAYSVWKNTIYTISKDGVWMSNRDIEPGFVNQFKKVMEDKWVIDLKEYEWSDILVDKWIKVIVK